MDVLSWSRHHRLFPGEGAFDLRDLRLPRAGHRLRRAAVAGGLQRHLPADRPRPHRRARPALAALAAGQAAALQPEGRGAIWPRLTPMPSRPTGFDFVEIKAEDTSDVEVLLEQLGFTPADGTAPNRCPCGRGRCPGGAQRSSRPATGFRTSPRSACRCPTRTPPRGARRELMAPAAYRRTYATEQALGAAVAPDGTEMFWAAPSSAWVDEFENGLTAVPTPVRGIDHVNLAQPWQTFDDAVLFFTSVFGLSADAPTEVPGPRGLVRSQSMRTADGAVRLLLNVAPPCARRRRTAPARGVRMLRRHRAGPGRARARGRSCCRFPTTTTTTWPAVRPRRGTGDRAARARSALRPRRGRRIRALLHPHRRQALLQIRAAARTNTTATVTLMRQCGWLPNATRGPASDDGCRLAASGQRY